MKKDKVLSDVCKILTILLVLAFIASIVLVVVGQIRAQLEIDGQVITWRYIPNAFDFAWIGVGLSPVLALFTGAAASYYSDRYYSWRNFY